MGKVQKHNADNYDQVELGTMRYASITGAPIELSPKLITILKENPKLLFLLNQNLAIVAAYAATLFIFPTFSDQGEQRETDILVGAVLIGLFSGGNFITDLVAACKGNKALERHVRTLRNTTLNMSTILSSTGSLAKLFEALPASDQNKLTDTVIAASNWLTSIGYWRALVLSAPIASVSIVAGILNRRYKIDNKKWARGISHVGSVIIDALAMYSFTSLPLGFAEDFNPDWVSPWLTKNLPLILALVQLVLSAPPDERELKSNAILKYLSRTKRGYDSVFTTLKLAAFNFMVINNIISFIAEKMKDLEYPNPIAYSLLNSSLLIGTQLGYLIFRLKSAANENPDDEFFNFNYKKNLVSVFSYEWFKSLFAAQALLGGTPWALVPAITSSAIAVAAREKNWGYFKHLNSYFFDAALVASCGLSTYGAAVIAPVTIAMILMNATIDTVQARHQYPLLDYLRSTVRSGLTGYVLGSSFFPASWPGYSPFIAAAGTVLINTGEIVTQRISKVKQLENEELIIFADRLTRRNTSSPAHLALSIILAICLSAREAYSPENSQNTWPEQLMLGMILLLVSGIMVSSLCRATTQLYGNNRYNSFTKAFNPGDGKISNLENRVAELIDKIPSCC